MEDHLLVEKVLLLTLQFLSTGLQLAAGSESRKLAFKLHMLASLINLPLILVLAVQLMALLTGAMQPPISKTVKCIMWVTLAVSYFIFALGTVLNLMA